MSMAKWLGRELTIISDLVNIFALQGVVHLYICHAKVILMQQNIDPDGTTKKLPFNCKRVFEYFNISLKKVYWMTL